MSYILTPTKAAPGNVPKASSSPDGDEMVQDPSCNVYVLVSIAIVKKIGGKPVYFCSEECAKKYIREIKE